MIDPTEIKLKQLERTAIYFRATIGLASLFLVGSILFYFTSDYGWIPNYYAIFLYKISIGCFTASFTAAVIQYVRKKTTDENMKDDLQMIVYNAIEIHDKDRDIFSPFRLYHPFTDDADIAINNLLTNVKVQHVNFFGTSGNYLFKERLLKKNASIWQRCQFQLLLHDPKDNHNIEVRAEQMEYEYGDKVDVEGLKSQIIVTIIRAIYLRSQLTETSFHIKLHTEKPDYRLEFYGENDVFVSFSKSGKSEEKKGKGAGPMAHYKKAVNGYMYDVYENIFFKAWNSVRNKEIVINGSTNFTFQSLSQITTPNSINNAVKEILKSHDEDNELQKWLTQQITEKYNGIMGPKIWTEGE